MTTISDTPYETAGEKSFCKEYSLVNMARNKVQRSFRLPPDVAEAVDQYAEDRGITKSEAYRRILKQGVEVNQSDVTVLYGKEKEQIPDGGVVRETQDQVERTQNQVGDLSEEVDSLSKQVQQTMLPVIFGILWLGVQVTVGFPFEPIGTAVTGIPLFLWLVFRPLNEIYG